MTHARAALLISIAIFGLGATRPAAAQRPAESEILEEADIRDADRVANVDPQVQEMVAEQLQRDQHLQTQAASSLSPAQRRQAALQFLALANTHTRNRNHRGAQSAFERAVAADASDDTIYLAMAVHFRRTAQYRRSLAVLRMLEGGSIDSVQLAFQTGTTLMQMGADDEALDKLAQARSDGDSLTTAPTASFHMGLIEMKRRRFPEAKAHFQWVLDNSRNPKLDMRAERKIEEILREEGLAARNRARWGFAFSLGPAYDSNVLGASEHSYRKSLAATRMLYSAGIAYKAWAHDEKTLGTELSVTDAYSWDNQFKADPHIQTADGLLLSFRAPYTVSKKDGYSIAPGFQSLFMTDGGSDRKPIFNSAFLSAKKTFEHDPRVTTDIGGEVSFDAYSGRSLTGTSNPTSTKYSAWIGHASPLSRKSPALMSFDLLFSLNDALGVDAHYKRFQLAAAILMPTNVRQSNNLFFRALAGITDFDVASTNRKDVYSGASAGFIQSFNPRSVLTYTAVYRQNASDLELYRYSKHAVMVVYSYQTGYIGFGD